MRATTTVADRLVADFDREVEAHKRLGEVEARWKNLTADGPRPTPHGRAHPFEWK